MLWLDVPIKGNLTLFMLKTVQQYRLAFDAMVEEDIQCVRHFKDDYERLG